MLGRICFSLAVFALQCSENPAQESRALSFDRLRDPIYIHQIHPNPQHA
jgi:hypothetical protein